MRAFRQGLAQLGWEEGKNVKFEYRWAAGNSDRLRADAAQLANLTDLIVAQGTPMLPQGMRPPRYRSYSRMLRIRSLRFCAEFGASGRQYHWICVV
jgi:hypothetical protein